MNNIVLEDGEVACDKCGGNNPWLCPKCFGSGKLDWVENIVGKIGPVFYVHFSESTVDFPQVWAKEIAEEMAKEIDRQILENIHQGKYLGDHT